MLDEAVGTCAMEEEGGKLWSRGLVIVQAREAHMFYTEYGKPLADQEEGGEQPLTRKVGRVERWRRSKVRRPTVRSSIAGVPSVQFGRWSDREEGMRR